MQYNRPMLEVFVAGNYMPVSADVDAQSLFALYAKPTYAQSTGDGVGRLL